MKMMNQRIKQLCLKCGLFVRKKNSIPFGQNWFDDIRYYFKGEQPSVIFDVGANQGQTAVELTHAFPQARIFSFEPVATTYAILQKQVRFLGNVETFQCALGAAPGQVFITAEPGSGSNTIISPSNADQQCVEEVAIDTVDLFCKRKRIDRIDILKMDTEGHENQVLQGATSMLASRNVQYIFAECDFSPRSYEPHTSFQAIYDTVFDYGFRVVAFYAGGVDELGWRWGNVLFRHVSTQLPGKVDCSPHV